MGLFGPYVYKSKSGQKYYLHMRMKGKVKLFFFSKEPADSVYSLPSGYEVVENPRTGLPFLKKKLGGSFMDLLKAKEPSEKSQSEQPPEK